MNVAAEIRAVPLFHRHHTTAYKLKRATHRGKKPANGQGRFKQTGRRTLYRHTDDLENENTLIINTLTRISKYSRKFSIYFWKNLASVFDTNSTKLCRQTQIKALTIKVISEEEKQKWRKINKNKRKTTKAERESTRKLLPRVQAGKQWRCSQPQSMQDIPPSLVAHWGLSSVHTHRLANRHATSYCTQPKWRTLLKSTHLKNFMTKKCQRSANRYPFTLVACLEPPCIRSESMQVTRVPFLPL